MATPSTPGEERNQSLRRTRWALAGVAVGGAVLATGAVAVLDGGGNSAAATPSGGPTVGQFRPGDRESDHGEAREHDDDDRGGVRGLTPQQLQQLLEQRQRQEQQYSGGGQQQQQYQQPPQQQYRAPQSQSRGS
jgi:hypothetical protein